MKVIKILIIIIFISIVPCFIFLIEASKNMNVYINRDQYKKGIFIKDSVACGGGNDSDNSFCVGYGRVKAIKTSVVLGLTYGTNVIFGSPKYADLNKNKFIVFYKADGKNTLLNENNELKIDAKQYLTDSIFGLIYPLIIFPGLILYFLRKRKQIKKNEDETN
jgi:hypothetical protein